VNTVERLQNWVGIADSIDGSGITKFDHMLEKLLAYLENKDKQEELQIA